MNPRHIGQMENLRGEGDADISSAKEETLFDRIVGHLEDILIDDNFVRVQKDFLDKYCDEFEDTEENKLIYMDIFEKYVSILEEYIEDKLKQTIPNFEMDTLFAELKENAAILEGEVFEMLYTLSDFSAFKSLMLDHKLEREGKNEHFMNSLTIVSFK